MLWITLSVFLMTLVAVLGLYFILGASAPEKAEVRKRLSLLELRNIHVDDISDVLKTELLSDVPAMQRILARFDFAVRIDKRLRQADMKIRVGTFVLLSMTLLALGILVGRLLHWPLLFSLLLGIPLFFIPVTVVNVKRRLRMNNFMRHFPDALEMFARSLRAGHSFIGAIQLVAQEMPDPIAPEFQKVFDEQNLGMSLRQALAGMADRVDSLDVKFFITAILIQRETGGNLAEIIDKISYVIRERFRVQGQLRIFTAQARMTGIILVLLPVAVAVVIGMLNPEYLKPLWSDRVGRILILVAVLLQVTGSLVIRKIIRIKI